MYMDCSNCLPGQSQHCLHVWLAFMGQNVDPESLLVHLMAPLHGPESPLLCAAATPCSLIQLLADMLLPGHSLVQHLYGCCLLLMLLLLLNSVLV